MSLFTSTAAQTVNQLGQDYRNGEDVSAELWEAALLFLKPLHKHRVTDAALSGEDVAMDAIIKFMVKVLETEILPVTQLWFCFRNRRSELNRLYQRRATTSLDGTDLDEENSCQGTDEEFIRVDISEFLEGVPDQKFAEFVRLRISGSTISEACEKSGIPRSSFYRDLEKFQESPEVQQYLSLIL